MNRGGPVQTVKLHIYIYIYISIYMVYRVGNSL